MPRSCRSLGLWLVLAVGATSSACDSEVPGRGTLSGWPPGDPLEVGACRFLLTSATLYHSSEWHLGVELRAENTGSEAVKCGFSARAMTPSDTPLTDAATTHGKLAPGERWTKSATAREADMTGISTGAAEGAWVYVEVAEGSWPMAKRSGVHVTPERTRPPD